MKRLSILFVLLPAYIGAHSCTHFDDATSKTFFTVRPQYSTGSPEHLSLYRNRTVLREDGIWASVQAVIFGGASTNQEGMARYFMPSWNTCVKVAEGPNPLETAGAAQIFVGGSKAFKEDDYELLARNFGIVTAGHDFESRICFCPKQTFFGVALNYKQSLSHDEERGLWFDITMPVIHVKNDMGLSEQVINPGTPLPGAPANMRQAFNQEAWKFGKISPCALEKTAISDIEGRIGYDILREETCRCSSFLGIIFPTGNRPKAEYVFEPIVGRNKHWGVIWGSSFGFELWSNEKAEIDLVFDTNNNYLFEGDEIRSFDLIDKQWSRYIPMFTDSSATTTVPGINVLTRCLNIRPRGLYQFNTAFIFKYKRIAAEVGFHFFIRQSESGFLKNKWVEGPAIAGVNSASGADLADSMSLATMRDWNYSLITQDFDHAALSLNPANNSSVYKPITEADLNIQSALHPSAISYAAYGSAAWSWDDYQYPTRFALGGAYQFATDNTAMTRYSVWGKCVVSL